MKDIFLHLQKIASTVVINKRSDDAKWNIYPHNFEWGEDGIEGLEPVE